MPQDDTQ